MPRIVDHDARRRELAHAVWEIIRADGLQGVTIRAVADRSGWSSGAVRHYLPTHDAILTFAAQQVVEEMRTYLHSAPRTGDALRDFRKILLATLPRDAESRATMEIWLAFVGAAVTGEGPAQHALLYDDLHTYIVATLDGLAADGWLDKRSVRTAAIEVHGLIDGLAVHLLLDQITTTQAERAIGEWIKRNLRRP